MAPRSRLWPDPRVKPPFGAAEIDWAHPLTLGLVGYWLVNDQGFHLVDLVYRADATSFIHPNGGAGFATYEPTPAGTGLSFVAANKQVVDMTPTIMAPQRIGGGDFSIVVRGIHRSVTGVQNWYRKDSTGGRSIYLIRLSGGVFEFGVGLYTAITWNPSPAAGALYHMVGTRVFSSGAHVFYGNGVLQSTGSSYSGNNLESGTQTYWIGSDPLGGGAECLDGWLLNLSLYNRTLTAGDALWLYAEPYAMLRPIIRRRYFVLPPGPDTLIGDGAAVAMAQSGKGIGVYISEQRPKG